MVRDAVDSFRGPPVGTSQSGVDLTSRFGSLSSNGRITLWSAAWDDFERNPVAGAGAGSFEWYWAKHQPYAGKARDAHSLYAETFAELGVVGFVLIVLALGLPLLAVIRARRRPLMSFAAAAYFTFIAHLGADWDWEMPIVILPGLFCAAALLVAARRTDEPVEFRPWARGAAVGVVALVGVFAFTAMIGTNALAAARDADVNGDLPKAETAAQKATDWTPWSAEPWKELGNIQRQQGKRRAARVSYRKAIDAEPLDYDAWLGLGYVTAGATQRHAFATARRLYPNNPTNPRPAEESAADEARVSPYAECMGVDPLRRPEELIRRVYSYVAYRIGDGPEAEDVTSSTFERALRYRSSFDPAKGSEQAWVLGIARTCIADHFRTRPGATAEVHDVRSPVNVEVGRARPGDRAGRRRPPRGP